MNKIPEERLLRLWDRYDENNDGVLQSEEISAMMNILAEEDGIDVPLPDAFIRFSMKQLDFDGDGISKDEFLNNFNTIWAARDKYSKRKTESNEAYKPLTEVQIGKLFKAFSKADPRYMSYSEFERMVKAMQEKDSREVIKESKLKMIFQKMDVNGDDRLSRDLFLAKFDVYWKNRGKKKLEASGKVLSDSEMRELWKKSDVNGDGSLSLREFGQLLNSLQAAEGRDALPESVITMIYQRIDKDGSGSIQDFEFFNNINIFWENRENIEKQAITLGGGEEGMRQMIDPGKEKAGAKMENELEVFQAMVDAKRGKTLSLPSAEPTEKKEKVGIGGGRRMMVLKRNEYPTDFIVTDDPLDDNQLEVLYHKMGGVTDLSMDGLGLLTVEHLIKGLQSCAVRDDYPKKADVDPVFISWLSHALNGKEWKGRLASPIDVTKTGFLTRWNEVFWKQRTYQAPVRRTSGDAVKMLEKGRDPTELVIKEQILKEQVHEEKKNIVKTEIEKLMSEDTTMESSLILRMKEEEMKKIDDTVVIDDHFLMRLWDAADTDRSGDLNYVELRTLLQTLNKIEGGIEIVPDDYVRKIFALLDPDNDKKIFWPDFYKHFGFFWRNRREFDLHKKPSLTEEILRRLWKRYDEDNSGYLDYGEFDLLLRKLFTREGRIEELTGDKLQSAFLHFDPDKSQKITWGEFIAGFNTFWGSNIIDEVPPTEDIVRNRLPLTLAELRAAWIQNDDDKDGILGRAELRKFLEYIKRVYNWPIIVSDATVEWCRNAIQPDIYMEIEFSDIKNRFNEHLYLRRDIFAVLREIEDNAPSPPLSDLEMGRIFREYEKDHRDKMSYKSFNRLIDAIWIQAGFEPGTFSLVMPREFFDEIDENQSGFLEWDEFKRGFQNVFRTRVRRFYKELEGDEAPLTPPDITLLFRSSDKDGDNKLKRFELEFLLDQMRTDSGLYHAKLRPNFISRAMRELDPEGWGEVTQQDFAKGFNKFWTRQKQRFEAHEAVAELSRFNSFQQYGNTLDHVSPEDFILIRNPIMPQLKTDKIYKKINKTVKNWPRMLEGPVFYGSVPTDIEKGQPIYTMGGPTSPWPGGSIRSGFYGSRQFQQF